MQGCLTTSRQTYLLHGFVFSFFLFLIMQRLGLFIGCRDTVKSWYRLTLVCPPSTTSIIVLLLACENLLRTIFTELPGVGRGSMHADCRLWDCRGKLKKTNNYMTPELKTDTETDAFVAITWSTDAPIWWIYSKATASLTAACLRLSWFSPLHSAGTERAL